MKTEECEILIVGGGPAGLSVASTLPDDMSCIVVHQDREIGLPVRTSGGSWLDDVQRLGIPEDLYLPIRQSDAFTGGIGVTINLGPHVPVILHTERLYKWLAGLSDHKARQLWLGCKFTDTRQERDGRYRSTIRDRDGRLREVRSRFIVDASGWHSAVLTSLGLARKPERLALGIEYEYPLGRNRPDRALIFVGDEVPSGYGWGFPTLDGTFRLGVGIISPDTDASPRKVLDALLATGLEQRFGLDLSGEYTTHGGILPSVPFEGKMLFGNVIRVGDSANFATPTVGEGIRVCIEFGRLLGEALGRTARTGRRWPLRRYEWRVRRRLQIDYALGFVVNRRGATFTQAHWNRTVDRLGRLDPDAVAAILKSEFPPGKILRMGWHTALAHSRARLRRLRQRLARQGAARSGRSDR